MQKSPEMLQLECCLAGWLTILVRNDLTDPLPLILGDSGLTALSLANHFYPPCPPLG